MRAEVAEGRIGPPGTDAPRLVLAKSRTFMNETGWAVTRLLAYYKLEPSQMIVVHDELDIEPGQLRVKFGGGDNGHNGLKSIRKSPRAPATSFGYASVLAARPAGKIRPISCSATFPASAREGVEVEISRAADAVESLVLVGLDKTQSAFNN